MIDVNPSKSLGSSKGLRQGEPLSPILFILVMEILSRIIGRMVEGDYLVGLMVEGGNRRFSEIYLLFSDDTIILCEANPLHFGYMWCVLCLKQFRV
jgi:hypothetical protein